MIEIYHLYGLYYKLNNEIKTNMRLFSKKKSQVFRDLHGERYQFEYEMLPSMATFAPMQLFCVDFQGKELLNFILDEEEKKTAWGCLCEKEFCMKIYDVGGGQISMLTFPTPEASPELAYAAISAPNHLIEKYKDESDLYYRPYYILAKVVDKWCLGEIKHDKGTDKNAYYPVYYQTIEQPDPVVFMKWVMEREGFTKIENLSKDPIEDFLTNN